jgi:hypothetical protein
MNLIQKLVKGCIKRVPESRHRERALAVRPGTNTLDMKNFEYILGFPSGKEEPGKVQPDIAPFSFGVWKEDARTEKYGQRRGKA